jgi:hypothetical protein
MLSKIFALYGLNFFFGNLVLAGAVLIVPITLALTRQSFLFCSSYLG